MVLQALRVQNFRSLLDTTLTFNNLTVLVGSNGAGKSALLTAIRLLQDPTSRDPTLTLGETDFYGRDTLCPIVVEGTFVSLTQAEMQFFDRYVHGGELVVRREFVWVNSAVEPRGSSSYLSSIELERISQAGSVAEKKQFYQDLMAPTNSPYHDMPQQWTTKDQFETDKLAWIQKHPDLCSPMPDGDFFGPKGKGTSYLRDHWEILYIPAVQDPADVAQDSKSSALTKLVDMAARNALTGDTEFSRLSAELQSKYSEYLGTHTVNLERLAERVSQSLGELVPGSSLGLKWNGSQGLDIRLPVALPEIIEDGFAAPITHVGSGLQRACAMSLLQQLTTGSSARPADTDMPERAETLQALPSYMMVIEEPELYQHPDRQRHFKHVFSDLSHRAIEGVSNATQVCYCTHSPLFVDMGRFDSVRLCRKTAGRSSDAPRQTQVVHASVDDIRKALSSQETLERLQSKLQTIMTPVMNEGFFAHAIVLVEGDDDRGAILGTARHLGYDLESMGVAVIPCTGKNNIDRAWAVFKTLGTPVYVVWDNDRSRCTYPMTCDCSQCHSKSDCKAHASTNERLLKILGQTPVGQLGQQVQDTYACFENNLESTIKDDLTAVLYEELLQEVVAELGTQEDEHPIKNPAVICEILERAAQRNKPCSTLEAIVKRVLKMVDLPRA